MYSFMTMVLFVKLIIITTPSMLMFCWSTVMFFASDDVTKTWISLFLFIRVLTEKIPRVKF